MNVTHDEPDTEHVLLFVIAGNSPGVEFTAAAKARVEQFHKMWKSGVSSHEHGTPGFSGAFPPRVTVRETA